MTKRENKTITSVQEALDELRIPIKIFYRLRQIEDIPRLPGQRFITTTKQLYLWLERLQRKARKEDND